jgi:hypothetical protein
MTKGLPSQLFSVQFMRSSTRRINCGGMLEYISCIAVDLYLYTVPRTLTDLIFTIVLIVPCTARLVTVTPI